MARSAEVVAEQLISIYRRDKKRFTLSKYLFKRIAGKEHLRDAFLEEVDECLKEDGYVLINLISEHDLLGVLKIRTIISKWEELDEDFVFGYIYHGSEEED